MEEFDIRDFCKEYLHYFWLIVVLTLVGWLCATFYTFFLQVPLYESHTSLVLTNSSNQAMTQNDVTLNTNLVSTYQEIVKSRLILNKVIDNLGINREVSELKDNIKVTSVENTELINISVVDTNNKIACDIANEIAKVFTVEITNIYNLDNVSVVDVANVSPDPSNVSVFKQLLLGAFGGFGIANIIILLMYLLDDKIKRKEDIEEKCEISLLSTIPLKLGSKKLKNSKNKNKKKNDLVVKKSPKSMISESFRSLRTNLDFLSVDKANKTFLITSSMPGEGKSFVAANLAYTLAQTGKKVLLVDCDLRNGRQDIIFNKPKSIGLSDLICDMYASNNFSKYMVKGDFKNFDILFKGTMSPNPSELLESERNKSLIETFKKNYDFVIFDSAPLNERLTDSTIMSRMVDGVIIVAENNKTPIHFIKETKKELEKVNANILGVVLNKIKEKNKTYGSYYGK